MGPPKLLSLVLSAIVCWHSVTADCELRDLEPKENDCGAPQSAYSFRPGCKVRARCRPNHYPEQERYRTVGVMLVCQATGKWKEEGQNNIFFSENFRCASGCDILNVAEMANATMVDSYPRLPPGSVPFDNVGKKVWPIKTEVKTKCKPNYIFSNNRDLKKPEGIVDHWTCTGGAPTTSQLHPWNDNDNKLKAPGSMPAMCVPLCDPIKSSSLPPHVKIVSQALEVKDPSTNEMKAAFNARAVLECDEGYKYEDGNPKQYLQCRGVTIQWADTNKLTTSAVYKQCISTGCSFITKAHIGPNTDIVSQSCNTPQTVGYGCTAVLKCKEREAYSPNSDYKDGLKMTCTQDGWVDQNQKPVKPVNGLFNVPCERGCHDATKQQEGTFTFMDYTAKGRKPNGAELIWPEGTALATKCNQGFDPKVPSADGNQIPHLCTPRGWVRTNPPTNTETAPIVDPFECVPSCPALGSAPKGTKYTNAPQGSATAGHNVKVSCEEGYELPKTIPYPNNQQTLECKGGPEGWFDPTTGTQKASPAVCVPSGAPGCYDVPDMNTQTTADPATCSKKDGLYVIGCKLTVTCKEGFIPKDSGAQTPVQNLVCMAKNDGWKNTETGKLNETALVCIPVCKLPTTTTSKTATITGPASSDKIEVGGKLYAKNGAQVEIKCKPNYVPSYTGETTDPGRIQKFVCEADIRRWRRTDVNDQPPVDSPTDACVGVCDIIPDNSLVNAVFEVKADATTYGNENKIREHPLFGYYVLKCKDGYKFPNSTSALRDNQQKLVCLGGEEQYLDPADNNKTNAKPYPCERGSTPGCSILDNKFIPTGANCKLEANKYNVGCTGRISCKDGTYNTQTGTDGGIDVICEDNQLKSSWRDATTGQEIAMPVCKIGCSGATLDVNSEYVNPADRKNFYELGEAVKVKCKAGSMIAGKPRTNPQQIMDYVCNGPQNGDISRPWYNSYLQTSTDILGGNCIAPCKYIRNYDSSLDMKLIPPKDIVETWGSDLYVMTADPMQFGCQNEYVYPSATPYSKLEPPRQTLKCDLTTGKWIDTVDGVREVTTPTSCESTGKGCPALSLVNSFSEKTQCPMENADGCQLTLRCNKGTGSTVFMPANGHSEPLQLTCTKGNPQGSWKQSNGAVYLGQGLKCDAACNLDKINKNSVYINRTSVNFIRVGETVLVKCVGEGVYMKEEISESNEIVYGCNEQGQITKKSKTIGFIPVTEFGEGCTGTCVVLDNGLFPSKHLNYQSPTQYYVDNTLIVYDQSEYRFTCVNDYEYPPNSPHARGKTQVLKCDGTTRKFIDVNTNQYLDQPSECVRKTTLPECKIPSFDSKYTSLTIGIGCAASDGFYNSGCDLTYVCYCPTGCKPTQAKYNVNKGEHILSCKKKTDSSNTYGWVDNFGEVVTSPMTCEPGCFPAKTTTFTRGSGEVEIIRGGNPVVEITCFKSTGSGTKPPPYGCPQENKTTTESNCVDACRVLREPLDYSIRVRTEPPSRVDHETGYFKTNSLYVLECRPGFTYPQGTAYEKEGAQMVRCIGNVWEDETPGLANKKFDSPQTCIKQTGCADPAAPNGNTPSPELSQGCAKFDGHYPQQCSLTFSCPSGTYPSDVSTLYNVTQTLVCENVNGEAKWKHVETGTFVTTATTCITGCKKLDIWETIKHIEKQTSTEVTFKTYRDTAGKPAICFEELFYNYLKEMIRKITAGLNKYFCTDELILNNTSINFGTSFVCPGTCILPNIPPSEGRIMEKIPFFSFDGNTFILKENELVITCSSGYQFGSSSIYTSGKQVFQCKGGDWIDKQTKAKYSESNLQTCVKTPTCGPVASMNTLEVTVTQEADGCTVVGGRPSVGCTARAQCNAGYRPVIAQYQRSEYQNLTCKLVRGAATWVDLQFGDEMNVPQRCEKGCLQPSVNTVNVTGTYNISEVTCKTDAFTVEEIRRFSFTCNSTGGDKTEMCTGACKPLQLNSGMNIYPNGPFHITVARNYVIEHKPKNMYHYMVDEGHTFPGETLSVRCVSADTRIVGTGVSEDESLDVMCDSTTLTYNILATGRKGITALPEEYQCQETVGTKTKGKAPGEKALVTGTCSLTSVTPDIAHTRPVQILSGKCPITDGDRVPIGCNVTLQCKQDTEFHIHPVIKDLLAAKETGLIPDITYVCTADGIWRTEITRTAKDTVFKKRPYNYTTLPDTCQKTCKIPITFETNRMTTGAPQLSTFTLQPDGKYTRNMHMPCLSGFFLYISKRNVYARSRNFQCALSDRGIARYVDENTKEYFDDDTYTESCAVKPNTCVPLSNSSTTKQETVVICLLTDEYKCTVHVTCKGGLVIADSTVTEEAFAYKCDQTTKLFSGINTTRFMGTLEDTCEDPKPRCADPSVLNTTHQLNVMVCTNSIAGYVCNIGVTCLNGYVVRNTENVKTSTLSYKCDDATERFLSLNTSTNAVAIERVNEVCVEPGIVCPLLNSNSSEQHVTTVCRYEGGFGYRCTVYIKCGDGRVIKNTQITQLNATYTCNETTKTLVATNGGPTIEEIRNGICTPVPKACDDSIFRNSTAQTIVKYCNRLADKTEVCDVEITCAEGYTLHLDTKTKLELRVKCNSTIGQYQHDTTGNIVKKEDLDVCREPVDPCGLSVLKFVNEKHETSVTCRLMIGIGYRCEVYVKCAPGRVIKTEQTSTEVKYYYECAADNKAFAVNGTTITVGEVNKDQCPTKPIPCNNLTASTVDHQKTSIVCAWSSSLLWQCDATTECLDGYRLKIDNTRAETTESYFCNSATKKYNETIVDVMPATSICEPPEPKCIQLVNKTSENQKTTFTCAYDKFGAYVCAAEIVCLKDFVLKMDTTTSRGTWNYACRQPVTEWIPDTGKPSVAEVLAGICIPVCDMDFFESSTTVKTNKSCGFVSSDGSTNAFVYRCQVYAKCAEGYILFNSETEGEGYVNVFCDPKTKTWREVSQSKEEVKTLCPPKPTTMLPPTTTTPGIICDNSSLINVVNITCAPYDTKGYVYKCKIYQKCPEGTVITNTTGTGSEYTAECKLKQWTFTNSKNETFTKLPDCETPATTTVKPPSTTTRASCNPNPIDYQITGAENNITCTTQSSNETCDVYGKCSEGWVLSDKLTKEGNYSLVCDQETLTMYYLLNSVKIKFNVTCIPVPTTVLPPTTEPQVTCTDNSSLTTNANTTSVCEWVNTNAFVYRCQIYLKCPEGTFINGTIKSYTNYTVECKNNTWTISDLENKTLQKLPNCTAPETTTVLPPTTSPDVICPNSTLTTIGNLTFVKCEWINNNGPVYRCQVYHKCPEGTLIIDTNTNASFYTLHCDIKEEWTIIGPNNTTHTTLPTCVSLSTTILEPTTPAPSCERTNTTTGEGNQTIVCRPGTMYDPREQCVVYINCTDGYVVYGSGKQTCEWNIRCEYSHWVTIHDGKPLQPVDKNCVKTEKCTDPTRENVLFPTGIIEAERKYLNESVYTFEPCSTDGKCYKIDCNGNAGYSREASGEFIYNCVSGVWTPKDSAYKVQNLRCVKYYQCNDLFEEQTEESYKLEHRVDILQYNGRTNCSDEKRCFIDVQCKDGLVPDYSLESNITQTAFCYPDGKWRYQSNNTEHEYDPEKPFVHVSCACGLLWCCKNATTITVNTASFTMEDTKTLETKMGSHTVRCFRGIKMINETYHPNADSCQKNTILELKFEDSISPCKGGCAAINTAPVLSLLRKFNLSVSTFVEPQYESGIAIQENLIKSDDLHFYGPNSGLRLYCGENFENRNTDVVKIICDGPTGKWMNREKPGEEIYNSNLPTCKKPLDETDPAVSKRLSEHCRVPQVPDRYKLETQNCGKGKEKIQLVTTPLESVGSGCGIWITCKNDESKSKLLICGVSQEWLTLPPTSDRGDEVIDENMMPVC